MPSAIAPENGLIGWGGSGFGPSGMVVVSSPRTSPYAQSVLKRFVALRELPREDEIADLRWGKPADFLLVAGGLLPVTEPEVTVIWPDNDEGAEDDDEEEPVIEYDEVSRVEEEIRVENPDDADQYVIVARVTTMLLRRRDDQRLVRFTFNPPR